ncbi:MULTISPECIES: GpE family phage tail protein [Brevundimonas]|uniref:GpE family phage tail protein n=1 Tax=Brevundimonas vesicularis TaxID=41276 RepID=A0A1Z3U7R3_BREVE|nr:MULTISPECIES: GpE family phage tail protein [Brevundimonas]ASE39336.1 GpE family phage tail protein [Brevundimonas vesicularis]MRL67886.1 GpE family phage tail protein [Brevundimonas sp. SPF441]
MQEVIAFAYGWTPDVLDDLTLDQMEVWQARAKERIDFMGRARCPLIG